MNSTLISATLLLQMKNSWARPMFRFTLIGSPILNTLLLYYMFSQSKQPDFFRYVILGAGLMGLWSSICFSSVGDINRERYMGTLSLIFSSPADFNLIILAKTLGNTLLATLTLGISFLTAKVVFKVPVFLYHPLYFAVALLLTIVTFAVFSLAVAYFMMLSRKTTLYMNLIELPIVFFSGFVFPVSQLPLPLQRVANGLPTRWSTLLLEITLKKQLDIQAFLQVLGLLLALLTGYFLLALYLCQRIEKQVRVTASLEVN